MVDLGDLTKWLMYVKRVSDLVACFGQSEQHATTEGPAR